MSENLTFYNPSVTASRATSLCTREAVLPPDSTPERCNTLYLADKACKKKYEQNCPYSFCISVGKTCFMEDTPCRAFCFFFASGELLHIAFDYPTRTSVVRGQASAIRTKNNYQLFCSLAYRLRLAQSVSECQTPYQCFKHNKESSRKLTIN